jgi:hypothetical protein
MSGLSVKASFARREEKRRVYEAFPLLRYYCPSATDPNYTLIEIVPASVTVKGAWTLDYHDVPL